MADRFSARAAAALRQAGWYPGRSVRPEAEAAVEQVCAFLGGEGRRHRAFPAAVEALVEFGGLTVDSEFGGEDHLPRPFSLDPTMAVPTTGTLADVSGALGVALFPLGVEGAMDAILVIDETGRVLSIDHAGEWLLGDDLPAAIDTLVSGRRPPRALNGGGWEPGGAGPVPGGGRPL